MVLQITMQSRKNLIPTKVDDEYQCIFSLEQCLMNIKAWVDSNRLRMDDGKTEYILFVSRSQLTKCTAVVVDVNVMEVPRGECICYLGAWLDQYMSLKYHITKKCTTAMLSFHQIKLIQRYLTKDAATTLVWV